MILETMKSKGYGLSQNDLNSLLNYSLDKVTVYRTLKTFEELGIIHPILDGSTHIKYALCQTSKCTSEHETAHIHFKCDSCEKTFCLNTIKIPNIELPKGFVSAKQFLSFQGKCQSCS